MSGFLGLRSASRLKIDPSAASPTASVILGAAHAPVNSMGTFNPICCAVSIVGLQPVSAVSAMTASGLDCAASFNAVTMSALMALTPTSVTFAPWRVNTVSANLAESVMGPKSA